MNQIFHSLVVLNALFAASAWCLARPTVLSVVALITASVAEVFFNGPLEGRVLVVFTRYHGITESDLLAVVGVAIAAAGLVRMKRRADREKVRR